MAAGKKRKTLVASGASASALERASGVGGEARSSRDSLQLNASIRKAEELSNTDCTSEPASPRPAPGHLFDDGAEAQGTTGELAGVASLQQPSGLHKPKAKS